MLYAGANRKMKEVWMPYASANQKQKEVWSLFGGVNRKVFSGGIPVSALPVGAIIKITENGVLTPYRIVHQGIPLSPLYDPSCNGVWVVREAVYVTREWHSANSNSYANSTIHSYLNGTFLAFFNNATQNAIRNVKIPYGRGATSEDVYSGADGLPCKIFLLAGREIGWTNIQVYDGYRLSYFSAINGESAQRIAYLDGVETAWWLRSPQKDTQLYTYGVATDGRVTNMLCTSLRGVRPALILQPDAIVSDAPDAEGAYILNI